MVYLGLSSPDERQAPAGAKWPRAGKAWTAQEEKQLRELYASGSTADEIAAHMNRPVESIRARMFYMGLTREAPISLYPPGDGGKAAQKNV